MQQIMQVVGFIRASVARAIRNGQPLYATAWSGSLPHMTREEVDTICAALPGAHWASHHDGGLDAWKVGDKMFACIGIVGDGVSVKCSDVESAQFLIEIGAAQKAKYFHRSWVRVMFEGKERQEMTDRIHQSYGIVRASLPKKVQATLTAWHGSI